MATSGSIDFNQTRNELIKDALITAEIIGLEDTVDDPTNAFMSRKLNKIIKAWQAEGCQLWKRKEATLFLAKNTQSYSISNASSSWHVTNSYNSTTSSAAAISGASTITLTSVSGMTAADNIGIELDDGTRQWTTISSINGSVITLATTLTAAVAADNTVVTYTTKINRPLKVYNARRHHLVDLTDVPIEDDRYEDFKDINNKASTGKVIRVMYDKQNPTGVLYVWQPSDNVKEAIKFTYLSPIEDFDSANDNPDFPQEWLLPIEYELAYHAALKFEKPTAERFQAEAMKQKEILKYHDNEESVLTVHPDLSNEC